MRKTFGLLALAGACLLGSTVAEAAPVTFNFSIIVDDVDDDGELFGPIAAGEVFDGYITYDTAAPNVDPTVGGGYYVQTGAFVLQTPKKLALDSPFFMEMRDNVGGIDFFEAHGWGDAGVGFGQGLMNLSVTDSSQTLFSSAALLANFDFSKPGLLTQFMYRATDGMDLRHHLNGQLVFKNGPTDPNPPAVPEPATLTMLGTGLLGLAKLRRRKGGKA